MYMHQALPKDIYIPNRHPYSIKNKRSPNNKLHSPRTLENPSDSSFIKYSSTEKTHLHHISSKEKPYLHTKEQSPNKPAILSKKYSIISDKSKKKQGKGEKTLNQSYSKQQDITKLSQHQIVICKMQNKVVQNVEIPFQYSDLSLIQPSFIRSYEGQSKQNGIRHGFGIQLYSNGQKFIGCFQQNMACGQGTYYALSKRVMGWWQQNKLRQIMLQMQI